MNAPRPSLLRLASAVVAAELARPGPAVHVADRILIRLHEHLGKLVGPAGFDVLLARSLVLARRADPGLAGCVAGGGGASRGRRRRREPAAGPPASAAPSGSSRTSSSSWRS